MIMESMNNESLIMRNVHKGFTQGSAYVPVLKGITATFERGNSYAITGISGSGKSTLIHILAGLDTPTSGQILYQDRDIHNFSPEQKSGFLNKSIGLVFQSPYLIKELTVQENVMLKGLIAGTNQATCAKEALFLLDQVGLSQKSSAYPGQLSGGQQQRVALARALMNQADFLIADEPTGNLDMQTGTEIIDLILAIQRETGMGIIISSHDEYVTSQMQMAYELKEGLLKIAN
jgi:lipoprotein-releasing system ATP-binding protein